MHVRLTGEVLDFDIRFILQDHAAHCARRNADGHRAILNAPRHNGSGADHTVIPNRDAFGDHAVAADETTVADANRFVFRGRLTTGECPLHGVVRQNLSPQGNAAVMTNPQTGRTVQRAEWTDPCVVTDLYVAHHCGRIVNRHVAAPKKLALSLPLKQVFNKWIDARVRVPSVSAQFRMQPLNRPPKFEFFVGE